MATITFTTFGEFAGVVAPGPAPAGKGRIYLDSATKSFKSSRDGGPDLDIGFELEFVYRPLEPAPSGNVFNDWATLVAAVALIPAELGPKVVLFDDSLSPIDLQPGAWDFGSYTIFRSAKASVLFPMQIIIEDGCTFDNVFEFDDVFLQSLSTTFVIDVPGAFSPSYYFRGNTQVDQQGLGGTFFQMASNQSALFWLYGVSAFSQNCLNVIAVGGNALILASEAGRIDQNAVSAVTGATVRGFILGAGVNLQTAQAGLVDAGGILPVFILPRSANVTYDDFLVLPTLNLLGANTIQEAVDVLKSKPIESWTFSGKLDGAVGPTGGFSLDLGPSNNQLSPTAVRYPRPSESGQIEILFYIHSNTLGTNADFIVYLDGVPTVVAFNIPPIFPSGAIAMPATLLTIVAPNGFDLRVETAAGGVGRSISYTATVRFLP